MAACNDDISPGDIVIPQSSQQHTGKGFSEPFLPATVYCGDGNKSVDEHVNLFPTQRIAVLPHMFTIKRSIHWHNPYLPTLPSFWLLLLLLLLLLLHIHNYNIIHNADNIDRVALQELFAEYDNDRDGSITVAELEKLLVDLGVAPLKNMDKLSSASSDKSAKAKENETAEVQV